MVKIGKKFVNIVFGCPLGFIFRKFKNSLIKLLMSFLNIINNMALVNIVFEL